MSIMRRRDILGTIAKGACLSLLIPSRLVAAIDQDPRLLTVNPEYRAFAAQLITQMDRLSHGPLSAKTLPQSRSMAMAMAAPRLPGMPVEKRLIPGKKGQPDITIYLVNFDQNAHRPAIVHMHGGGFVSGTAAASVGSLQDLCKTLGCAAISVEYRLAPEARYTESVEDNYSALRWLYLNAASLGVDPTKIAVMGESAGGGHAALLAIAARDRGEIPIAFQCLIYPMLDDRTGTSRAFPSKVAPLVWGKDDNRFGWASFLGVEPGTRAVPAQGVPARLDDVRGLPPGFIGVGSIDLFLDEDMGYARRLNDAGVATELFVAPGCFHGFDLMPVKTRIGSLFTTAKIDALRTGLGIPASASS